MCKVLDLDIASGRSRMPPRWLSLSSAHRQLSCRIVGGIGNQLFQYAAGLAFARAWGADLVLDLTARDHGTPAHPRRFMLDDFMLAVPFYQPVGLERLVWKLLTSRNRHLHRFMPVPSSITRLDETTPHCVDPRLNSAMPSSIVSMYGYWQSAHYPALVEGELRKALTFRHPAQGANAIMLERIKREPSAISLHVRRGDYTLLKDNPVLDARYYQVAAAQMAASVRDPIFFIFSDTPDWARQSLELKYPTIFVDSNSEDSAMEDLRLMAACRHHIIANSSFSWWAAWLSNAPDKRVMAPRYWMMRPDTFYPQLFPAGWELIDNLTVSL